MLYFPAATYKKHHSQVAKTSKSFSEYFSDRQGVVVSSNTTYNGVGSASTDDHHDTLSTNSDSPYITTGDVLTTTPEPTTSPPGISISPLSGSSTLRRLAFRSDTRTPRTQTILVVGPPG